MRIVKQRLLEMLPDVCVFLDVDDLKTGKGAEYVDVSSITLIFCSVGYFASPNCMREILRTVVASKPIITLLEPEPNHGGMTRNEIHDSLQRNSEPWEKAGIQHMSKYAMWGLEKEVASWGYHLPTSEQLQNAPHPPLHLARVTFQGLFWYAFSFAGFSKD